jgi:hypothetical protein
MGPTLGEQARLWVTGRETIGVLPTASSKKKFIDAARAAPMSRWCCSLGSFVLADPPDSPNLHPFFLSNLSQVSSVGSARLCMCVLPLVVELHHRSRSPRGASSQCAISSSHLGPDTLAQNTYNGGAGLSFRSVDSFLYFVLLPFFFISFFI